MDFVVWRTETETIISYTDIHDEKQTVSIGQNADGLWDCPAVGLTNQLFRDVAENWVMEFISNHID